MAELRYTKSHEWARLENGVAAMGISSYAQEQLGDVVYVELPAVGKKVAQLTQIAVVESVKAASEVYAPVGGAVVEVNEAIVTEPALVNQDAEESAWFLKVKIANPRELDGLMSADAYRDYLETLE